MYCIAGFRKVKSAQEFTAIANHNNRIRLTKNESKRIDSNRSMLNKVLINPLGISSTKAPDINQKIMSYYEQKEISVRKDSVLAIDLMLTTSPEYFGEWQKNGKITDQKKIDEWVLTQIDFVKKQFGEEAVKYAVLHLDETTPHIHFLVTPEETKTVKYKNRFGSGEKIKTSLNADRWNPSYWKRFLTNYEKANKKFGLKKGEEGSLAENVSIKDFMKMVAEASQADYKKAIQKIIGKVTEDLSMINRKSAVEDLLYNKLLPLLNQMTKQNKALKKMLLQDRAKEYEQIKKMKKMLEEEIESTLSRKEHYIEAINGKIHDSKLLKEQQDHINKLEAENKRLKKKYEPELRPSVSLTKSKFKHN